MNRERGQREERGRREVSSDRRDGVGAAPQPRGGKHRRTSSFSRWWHFNWRYHRGGMILLTVLIVLAVLAIGITVFWKNWAVAPDIPDISQGGDVDDGKQPDSGKKPNKEPSKETAEKKEQFEDLPITDIDAEIPDYVSNQKDGVYTFLVIGRTRMDDNADMIMLVIFDSNTGKVDACNIPRDTMVNIDRDVKKINSTIFGGVKYLKSWVRKTLGVQPNFYVMLDWDAVGDMVEAIGGVYYNVPFLMHYVDTTPGKEFTIYLEPGYQLLDGDKAMQFIRWRQNNMGGTYKLYDEGRMKLQQQFITSVAYQILKPQNALKFGTFADIFKENVETDLTVGNMVWFAQQALKLDSINQLTFHKLPGNYGGGAYSFDMKNYQSYVTYYPNQLLELINLHLNPYAGNITLGDLDLMRINKDGTISSSTGVLADADYNDMIAAKKAVDEGLAYYDDEGNLVYIDPNDPDAPVDPDDPQNPDDPENPDNPQNPDTPQNPDDPNSGTGEQTGGETGGQTGEGETGTGTGEQTGGQAGAESGEQTSGETGTGGEGQITEPPAEPDQPTGPAEPNVNNGQQ